MESFLVHAILSPREMPMVAHNHGSMIQAGLRDEGLRIFLLP